MLFFNSTSPRVLVGTFSRIPNIRGRGLWVKEIIGKGDPEATKNHLVVGGFGDSMDTDPMAASEQRTQAVANYLTGKGVPKDTLDLRPFGATWARYEVGTKKAQEGRNRRIQIRLFPPIKPRKRESE